MRYSRVTQTGLWKNHAHSFVTIQDYSRNTVTNPFNVTGGGSRVGSGPLISNPDIAGSNYTISTTIRLQGTHGPINLAVSVNDFNVEGDVPVSGTISLVAQDGSRVDVAVPNNSGVVSINWTDTAGVTFNDSVAWTDLYQ